MIANVPATALVIDDDDTIRLAWRLEAPRLGLRTIDAFASLEECLSVGADLSQYDIAFVDRTIRHSEWTLAAMITRLKFAGIPRVYIASGADAATLAADPGTALADGVLPEKIPLELP